MFVELYIVLYKLEQTFATNCLLLCSQVYGESIIYVRLIKECNMARNEALITPQLLIWARERVAMPIDLAAKVVGVTIDKYKTWELGKQLPTVN